LKLVFDSEDALVRAAGEAARAWESAKLPGLIVGLKGDLGAGKTTWVRAMLRGLGLAGRVPSPTYTLLEHYEMDSLTVVHLDLYRLSEARELEFLGIRDWLARQPVWLLVEWPEKGGTLADSLDLVIDIDIGSGDERRISVEPLTERGRQARRAWPHSTDVSNFK
jgi:tRNA threonylcarbamoyladenosine biosynthesis protein TsaE